MKHDEFAALVAAHTEFGIVSHFRPDGDAIGSTLALGLALRALGKTVYLWNEDSVPPRYAFLSGADTITPLPAEDAELPPVLICVDSGDWKRLGDKAMARFAGHPCIVNIDHHGTNSCYGHLNMVDGTSAACGCMIFKLIRALGVTPDRAMAEALYTAISTDTGSFQYGSTTAEVMREAADLLECGIDVGRINCRLYQEIPWDTLRVNREVLNHMVLDADGQIAHYAMPAGTKERLGVGLEATKDLVDIVRVVEGVRVAAIFEDLEDGRIRISLRSKDPAINVADIAAQFGGGGHAMAAGIRVAGKLEKVKADVLEKIKTAIMHNEQCKMHNEGKALQG